jgi:hypothetical protein
MTNRDWFTLALRVFGIWLLIGGIEAITTLAVMLISELAGSSPLGVDEFFTFYTIYSALWNVLRTTIGLLVLFFAPAIAARFYPGTSAAETNARAAAGPPPEEFKPLRVGLQLLGVYALLLAVQSGSAFVVSFLSGGSSSFILGSDVNLQGNYLADLLRFGLQLAFAAILLIWNDRVVFLIEKFRYIPERDGKSPPGEPE